MYYKNFQYSTRSKIMIKYNNLNYFTNISIQICIRSINLHRKILRLILTVKKITTFSDVLQNFYF